MSYAIAVCHTPGCQWRGRDSHKRLLQIRTVGIAHSKRKRHLVHVVIERTYAYKDGEELVE